MRIFDRQISASIEPTRHKLNFEHFKYVVENCRKADNIEISLTGFTKETLVKEKKTKVIKEISSKLDNIEEKADEVYEKVKKKKKDKKKKKKERYEKGLN